MHRSLLLLATILPLLAHAIALGADWPQYRYDAGRTAASPEPLAERLHLQWVRDLPSPRPAFPNEVRLRFDATYEPVVAEGLMFVPSMVTDSVTALDTATGEERWRFFAEGPVRFAPAVWRDSVFFVSDDGYLYCLRTDDGSLLWRYRGLPEEKDDRRLLGNHRLVSLWPARGGPVAAAGVVYFAAGLWPDEGVYVHALDAETGEAIWSNTDSDHLANANMDHGISQYAGLAPQGYLALAAGRLVVPCGAQLAAFLDPGTGRLAPYHVGWGGRPGLPKGSWFVAIAGRFLSHSGDLYDLTRPNQEQFRESGWSHDFKSQLYAGGLTRLRIDRTNAKGLGDFQQPILTPEVLYESVDGIAALDLTQASFVPRDEAPVPEYRRDDKYPDRLTGNLRELWRLPCSLKAHIKAGSRLYAGGPGIVAAMGIPREGESPESVWQAQIQGDPASMLAANGRLFVVTREGRIYAFGPAKPPRVVAHQVPRAAPAPSDRWRGQAAEVLRRTEVQNGYAVVPVIADGRLVEELIRQSDLYVIAIDQDPQKVDRLRRRLQEAGLYGLRASVHQGDPLTFPLPPYLASLVVLEGNVPGRLATQEALTALCRTLRPYRSAACLQLDGARVQLREALAQPEFRQIEWRESDRWVVLRRRGPLPGASDWTHDLADAGNTGASTDAFLKTPLALLWFDGALRWHRKPGSSLVRVAKGRVLVKADTLHAIDAYTGRVLWEARLPFPHAAGDEMVIADDAIYVTSGRDCVLLDHATGRKLHGFQLPEGHSDPWSSVRLSQRRMVARSGPHVLCLDRHRGELAWRFTCSRPELSLAVGGGKVFCAELPNKRRGEGGDAVKTRALSLATGELLWETMGGSLLQYSAEHNLLAAATGVLQGDAGELVWAYPHDDRDDQAGPLFLIGDRLLWGTTESYAVLDLGTGAPLEPPTAWVRRGCTSIRASANMITTRFRANSACIDLVSREITSLWNVRPGCYNSLFPANGLLNAVNITGGCECNYTPSSQAFVPASSLSPGGGF